MHVENSDNKATLVTALYLHRPQEILGGRGWTFDFFASPFKNILSLGLPMVIYTHDKMEKELTEFMNSYARADFTIINQNLTEFKYSNQILKYLRASGRFKDDVFIDEKGINDRNTHLCLSKMYWLQDVQKENPFNSNNFFWIDAGLFHHGIFPETFGGMERFTNFYKKSSYYYPDNKNNIFNVELGKFLSHKVSKFLALIHKEMPINDKIKKILKTPHPKIGYVVGGLMGGPSKYIDLVFQDFDLGLSQVLSSNSIVLEEDLLSCTSSFNPDYYQTIKFNQWYHDIPDDPCYYGVSSKNKSFYKIFKNDLR